MKCRKVLWKFVGIWIVIFRKEASQVVKNLPASTGDTGDMDSIPGSGRSPRDLPGHGQGHGNPLQYLAWRILWTDETDGLQSTGLQRVRHSWATKHTRRTVRGIPFLVMWEGDRSFNGGLYAQTPSPFWNRLVLGKNADGKLKLWGIFLLELFVLTCPLGKMFCPS